jgi:UDP-2,3-diacylglucosamine pyrophosphatase LpxH
MAGEHQRRTRARERERSGSLPELDAHLLAISDLHLGRDLRRGLTEPRPEPAVDRPLVAFLDYYRAHRIGGLPWRLIIVGDMVDFIAITNTPAPDEVQQFAVSPEEHLYGLAAEPLKAAWKLGRVLERHARFRDALARFVADGNELIIIRGNHDPEWTWPEVRRTLVTGLAESLPAELAGDAAERASLVGSRVQFRDWFYLEPGRFYAEHGHLYDEFSSSEDFLPGHGRADPVAVPRLLREPLSGLAQRYFANKHSTLDVSEIELWSFMDFIRWAVRGRLFLRAVTDYFNMTRRVLWFSLRASVRATYRSLRALIRLGRGAHDEERLARVRAAIRAVRADAEEFAKEWLAVLRAPAERSLIATARLLYFDRLMLGAGVLACGTACVLSSGPTSTRGWIMAGAIAVAAGVNAWLARARMVDSHPKLIHAAQQVAVFFRVPVVVMGHTHRPISQPVGDGGRYYNLGTWLAPSSDGSEVGFPHVIVGPEGSALRRWTVSLSNGRPPPARAEAPSPAAASVIQPGA